MSATPRPLPNKVRDEVRRVIGIKIYSKLLQDDVKYTRADLHEKYSELYHGKQQSGGSSSTVSFVDMFLQAHTDYLPLLDKDDDPALASEDTASTYYIKPELIKSPGRYYLNTDITRASILRKSARNPKLLSGRGIYENAFAAIRNVRQACIFASKYVNEDGSTKVPPDASEAPTKDKVVNMILDDMYNYLQGRFSTMYLTEGILQSRSEDDAPMKEGELPTRPAGWVFHGYVAFLAYGSFADVNTRWPVLFRADECTTPVRKTFTPSAKQSTRPYRTAVKRDSNDNNDNDNDNNKHVARDLNLQPTYDDNYNMDDDNVAEIVQETYTAGSERYNIEERRSNNDQDGQDRKRKYAAVQDSDVTELKEEIKSLRKEQANLKKLCESLSKKIKRSAQDKAEKFKHYQYQCNLTKELVDMSRANALFSGSDQESAAWIKHNQMFDKWQNLVEKCSEFIFEDDNSGKEKNDNGAKEKNDNGDKEKNDNGDKEKNDKGDKEKKDNSVVKDKSEKDDAAMKDDNNDDKHEHAELSDVSASTDDEDD